jgi:hypothetical protein
LRSLIRSYVIACLGWGWWTLIDIIKRGTVYHDGTDLTSPHEPELGWRNWIINIILVIISNIAHIFIVRANDSIFRLNHDIVGRYTPM